jgi:F-type H+-transporting ATPase subunit epsilon
MADTQQASLATEHPTGPVQCVIVTPEKAVLDEAGDFVVIPMIDGELGIAHNRLPLIGRLGFGELRLSSGGSTKHYYIDGGFVQVRGNVVTVLTSKAMPVSSIKTDAAQEVLNTPKVETTPAGQEAQLKAQQRARAQLRLAQKNKESSN